MVVCPRAQNYVRGEFGSPKPQSTKPRRYGRPHHTAWCGPGSNPGAPVSETACELGGFVVSEGECGDIAGTINRACRAASRAPLSFDMMMCVTPESAPTERSRGDAAGQSTVSLPHMTRMGEAVSWES